MEKVKPQEVIQTQRGLAEALREQALKQSQQTYYQGQRALAEQMRMSREQSRMSRQQLEEQSYLTNRAISQGAQARGLGSSGLKDMSLLQSQLNQGQAVNQIQQQSDQQTRGIAAGQLGLSEQLASQKIGADVSYMQNMLAADQQAMTHQEQQTNQLLQLYQMALESGGTADINSLAAILGMDLQSLPEEQRAALEGASAVDLLGGESFGRLTGDTPHGGLLDKIVNYIDPSTVGSWAIHQMIGNKYNLSDAQGFLGGLRESQERNLNETGTVVSGYYDFGNGREKLSFEDATRRVQQMYEGRPYVGKEIIIKPDKGGDIRFYVKGKPFNTYNKAVEEINKAKATG